MSGSASEEKDENESANKMAEKCRKSAKDFRGFFLPVLFFFFLVRVAKINNSRKAHC